MTSRDRKTRVLGRTSRVNSEVAEASIVPRDEQEGEPGPRRDLIVARRSAED
jgi:hypothetical protein